MLKVIGASWFKTRVSSYIIAGACLLAIGSLFMVGMERPQFDGIYCATVYWTHVTGFRIEFWGQRNDLKMIPKGVARTCYKDSTSVNGWSQIEIETQPEYPDWVQAFAAGTLEGALTWNSIYNQWSNIIVEFCEKDEQSELFCSWLRDTISTNYLNIKQMADKKGKHNHYWHQIRLFYFQLEGLEFGWRKGVKRSRVDLEISPTDFLLLNAIPDINDLKIYYDNFIDPPEDTIENDIKETVLKMPEEFEFQEKPTKSTIIFKLLDLKESSLIKFLIGHSAAITPISSSPLATSTVMKINNNLPMLRMLKKYKFHYHLTKDHFSHEVSGVDIAFSGFPGCITSYDHYYTITGKKSKLTTAGIRMQNNNLNLLSNINLDTTVLLSATAMTANRLAGSGRSWVEILSKYPSITSKQWLIADIKRLRRLTELPIISLNERDDSVNNETEEEVETETHSGNDIDDFDNTRRNNNSSNSNSTNDNFGDNSVDYINDYDTVITTVSPLPNTSNESVNSYERGLIWIIDQLPGRLHAEDITQELFIGTHFWLGNGSPYFKETLAASNVQLDIDERTAFRKILANISDLEAVAKVLKTQAYRADIVNDNFTTFVDGRNIDIKIYSETNKGEIEFHALVGPLQHNQRKQNYNINNDNDLQNILNNPLDKDGMSEIEIYSERRSIRDDMRAAAMRKITEAKKQKDSDTLSTDNLKISTVNEEKLKPSNEWQFDRISPVWAWKHESTLEQLEELLV